jgi:N-acetylmuramoyl-L-alanine amidase
MLALALAAGGFVHGPARAGAAATATGVSGTPAAESPERPAPPQGGIRTVVIDPGHGGSEIGAVGPGGLTEKYLVLDIANRLSNMLVGRLGIDARMTRETDVDKALEERTAFANNLKADIFISIHANSYRGRGVRGAETFFLSDRATDDEAMRLAAIENDALELRGPALGDSDLQMLLWDMAQTAHLQESSVLAEMIQSNLNTLGGAADRGIKQAPFRVLKGANMPAVLVEVGFLSNPDEERLLADPSYRQRIADMLFESLNRYRRRQASLLGGSSPR